MIEPKMDPDTDGEVDHKSLWGETTFKLMVEPGGHGEDAL